MKTVLFACVQNAGRSQMAAAFFNAAADRSKARAVSAGSRPAERVHPEVVATMQEVGIDLSGAPTTPLTAALAGEADVVITMGCGDECPAVPGAERHDWQLDDPAGRPMGHIRAIRDEIQKRVEALIDRHDWR